MTKSTMGKTLILTGVLLILIISGIFQECSAKSAQQYFRSGKSKYTVEDYDGASEDFLAAIEKNPLMGDAYRALLSIWGSQGKDQRSVDFIETTIKNHGIDLDIDFKCYLFYKLANLYCNIENIPKAEEYLKKGYRISDSDPNYQTIKADIKTKKKRLISQAVKKVKSLMNKDLHAALNEAHTGLKIDYTSKELRSLMSSIKKQIKDIQKTSEARKYLAHIKSKLRANAWDEAIEICNEALAVQPENEEFAKLRDRAAKTKQRYFDEIEAKRIREEERKTRITKIDYFLKLGKKNMEKENWNLAGEAFENVLKLDSGNGEAKRWINQANEAMRLSDSIKKGESLFAEGKWNEAAALFKYAVEKVPASKKYAKLLAKTYIETSRYDEAIGVYKKYLGVNESANNFYNLIGDVYAMKDDHLNAMTYYRKYLDKNPTDLDITLKVGNSYKNMGQESQAVEFFKSAAQKLTEKKDKIKVYKELAISYEKAGEEEASMKTYRNLLEIDSTSEGQMIYYYKLGNLYFKNGQYNQALERYEEVEKIRAHYLDIDEKIKECRLKKYIPVIKFFGAILGLFLIKFLMGLSNPLRDILTKGKKDKLFQKAKVYRQQGKWQKAIDVCEIILKMPIEVNEAKELRLAVAHASFKMNKYDMAVSESEKVLDLDRNNKKAYKILGQTYMARKEYDRAIQSCKYVFDFDINNVAMHEIMQTAYKELNNFEELIMEYEEMTHMNPDNMQLRNMLLKLQKEQQ